jgi:hypothetical protein
MPKSPRSSKGISKSGAKVAPLPMGLLKPFLLLRFQKDDDNARRLFRQLGAFQLVLFDAAPERPQLLPVAISVCKLSTMLADTNCIYHALRQSPRRNIAGRGSVLERIGNVRSRAGLYKFLHQSLGIADIDSLRLGQNMDEVIALSGPLHILLEEVTRHHERLVRSTCPRIPVLYHAPAS